MHDISVTDTCGCF